MTAKISELTAAASSASTDLYEIETTGGASKKATAAQLLTYIEGAIGTAAFRALIDDASSAALLTTLGGQPLDSDLTAIAALGTTPYGRALLTKGDAAELQTAGGLVIGTNVQAYDAELAALAGLTSAADKGIQFTGSGTAATYDLTTAGKALLDDANAAAQLTTLGAASLASPTFTGVPAAPTAALATNTTQIATTAFVLANASGAPTTSKYLTTAADATLSAEIVIPGMAGNANIASYGGAGTSEEYDTSTTGLTWDSAPDTVDSNTTLASHLYIKTTASGSFQGVKAWAPAGDFDARCQVSIGVEQTTNAPAIGLVITDSGDANRLWCRLYYSSNALNANCYTYTSSTFTQRGSPFTATTNTAYLRIKRVSSTITFYFSMDGKSWILIASQSFSITVAKIGFRLDSAGASTNSYHFVDWLRTDV